MYKKHTSEMAHLRGKKMGLFIINFQKSLIETCVCVCVCIVLEEGVLVS